MSNSVIVQRATLFSQLSFFPSFSLLPFLSLYETNLCFANFVYIGLGGVNCARTEVTHLWGKVSWAEMKRACILRQLGRCASTNTNTSTPSSIPTSWSSSSVSAPASKLKLGLVASCGGVSCMSILLVLLLLTLSTSNFQHAYRGISTENIYIFLSM